MALTANTEKEKDTLPITVPREWINLEGHFRLRLIRTEKEYESAMKTLLELGRKSNMTTLESDFFDVLSMLVERYENAHYPIDTSDVSVIDVLESLMEEHQMNASDLGRLIGKDRTLGHKVLTGKRKLTTAQVRKLADNFHVSTDLFID